MYRTYFMVSVRASVCESPQEIWTTFSPENPPILRGWTQILKSFPKPSAPTLDRPQTYTCKMRYIYPISLWILEYFAVPPLVWEQRRGRAQQKSTKSRDWQAERRFWLSSIRHSALEQLDRDPGKSSFSWVRDKNDTGTTEGTFSGALKCMGKRYPP